VPTIHSLTFNLTYLFRFQVEFSKPLQTKPIPEGTVRVFFDVILDEATTGEESAYEIEFNFENESLKHKLTNTMRKNMFEVSCVTVLNTRLVAMD
jgi:uncharacterized protein YqiB (DUF1249 family)